MRIVSEQSLLSIIDIQERLTPHITGYEQIVNRMTRLIEGMKLLSVPMMLNEQYKKGLGETVEPVRALMDAVSSFEKVSFSVCDHLPAMAYINEQKRPQVILAGIETHVCVQQTALDLLDHHYTPVVVSDAVGSRHAIDHETAIARMRQAGVIITTTESLLFELCRSAKHSEFKAISALVK